MVIPPLIDPKGTRAESQGMRAERQGAAWQAVSCSNEAAACQGQWASAGLQGATMPPSYRQLLTGDFLP
jgi:hypothetical protein